MKPEWPLERLGDICETTSGGTPLKARAEYYENGDIPWLLSGEVGQRDICSATHFITEKGLKESAAKLFPENTVLVAMYGATAGQAGILRFRAATNQAVCGILPNGHFVPEFLFYALVWRKDELVAKAVGNAQPNISQIKIRDTILPVPPLAEQRRIIRILDEAFAAISKAKSNTEKNLQNARALFETDLRGVFALKGERWQIRRVSEIAKHSLGKMLDKHKNKGQPQHYLRNVNVRWFDFDLSDLLRMRFLPEEAHKYTARKGDVLVCEGGYPGRAAMWQEEYCIHFQKALHRVRFYNPDHSKWFVYFLYSKDRSGDLQRHFTGTGIQHFTGEVLSRFDELAVYTQRLEAIYAKKLSALYQLKQSLLHQAFSGNL